MITISKTLGGAFKHALATTTGIVLCDLILLFITIYGFNTLTESLSMGFTAIKYLGAVYLAWHFALAQKQRKLTL